ncbi:phosphatase PAP2 family protein [Herbaspirillum chlorophenolicum]|uniref:Phosphatase PAP2 family protein n=2 Tax=Herbaspirillum chlorophenolicum TaxID=211589 RepID=A0ABW8EWA5_9BURK
MTIWNAVTSLGDSAITVPGAFVLAIWLALNGAWKQAARWLFYFCCAMLLVVISKLLFMGWDIRPPFINFTGISGHTASAAAVYLSAAFLFGRERSPHLPLVLLGIATALVLTVGASRLLLHLHSESEVIAGLMTGAIAAWAFCRSYDVAPGRLSAKWAPAILIAALLLGTGGKPAPTHDLLQEIAMKLSGREQAFIRTEPL